MVWQPLVLTKRRELQEFSADLKVQGKRLGFVPTMGALHDGHATLLRKAVAENDAACLSIFVNPKQFGPTEDFARYPRTFAKDLEIASANGVGVVFAPTVEEMYPRSFSTEIKVPALAQVLCGAVRPGHFDGVCTVVMLLLNLAQAHTAYFGKKDFQQLSILRRMCLDLAHPTRIEGVATVREADGLAMSSRNRYLEADDRIKALAVPRALAAAAKAYLNGSRDPDALVRHGREVLTAAGFEPQYLELRRLEDLAQWQDGKAGSTDAYCMDAPGVLALALIIERGSQTVRLIDNIILDDDPSTLRELEDLIAKVESSALSSSFA